MMLELTAVAVIRALGSLPVLRWAFAGALLAIAVDFSDLFLWNLFGLDFGTYQAFDKWVDLVYMATFLVVTLRWQGLERSVGISLFIFRLVGVAAFEIFQSRTLLLLFPNVFEFWFLFVAGRNLMWPRYRLSAVRAASWLLALLILKEAQEFALHQGRYLDRYNAVEVVVVWWRWATGLF
ncbi:MAG: hypothetical protein FJ314_04385 [SAR202 cluster bacterium]|nr:hypothetical protein [SAR202 cluster bacterium]